jgi:hypothetical protein
MQRIAGRDAFQRLEALAVENGGVMIAGFHHHEQVERIGVEGGLLRQRGRIHMLDARSADILESPGQGPAEWGVEIGSQRFDLFCVEFVCEAGHLRGDAPGRNGFAASARLSRSRLSGSNAGPVAPRRSAPWQAAQWRSYAATGSAAEVALSAVSEMIAAASDPQRITASAP